MDDLIKIVAQEYKAGATLNFLAQKYQRHNMTIRNMIERGGIQIRPRGGKGGPSHGTAERILYIRQRRAEGWTLDAIGSSLGVSRQAVHYLLSKYRDHWKGKG